MRSIVREYHLAQFLDKKIRNIFLKVKRRSWKELHLFLLLSPTWTSWLYACWSSRNGSRFLTRIFIALIFIIKCWPWSIFLVCSWIDFISLLWFTPLTTHVSPSLHANNWFLYIISFVIFPIKKTNSRGSKSKWAMHSYKHNESIQFSSKSWIMFVGCLLTDNEKKTNKDVKPHDDFKWNFYWIIKKKKELIIQLFQTYQSWFSSTYNCHFHDQLCIQI